jgi:hypothetical protein
MALQTSSSLNIIGNKDVVISGETGFFVWYRSLQTILKSWRINRQEFALGKNALKAVSSFMTIKILIN